MVWTADNTIPEMKGKTLKLRELFAKAANTALNKGMTEEEATFAGTKAVRIEESKNTPAKVTAPKVPSHLQVLKDIANKQVAPVEKVKEIQTATTTVVSADINQTGHLVLVMSDGTRVTTKSPIPKEVVSQNISISNSPDSSNIAALEATQEPTGFETRSTSQLSFDDETRVFTISAVSNEFSLWLHAKEFTRQSESIQLPDISGLYFIHFTYPDCELHYTTTPTSELFLDTALVALVYWQAETQEHVYFADERHGIVMDGATHKHLHLSLGAQYRKGLRLYNFYVDANGNSGSHAQFACDSGQIADEDLIIDIVDGDVQTLSTVLNAPVYYRHGGETENWYKTPVSAYPLILPTNSPYYFAGTRPAYSHEVNGFWYLTEVPNNQFVLVHIAATNDVENPVVAILGNTYNTKSAARAGANTEFAAMSGLPFAEFVRLGTVIYQVSNTYTNTTKARVVSTDDGSAYIDYRDTSVWSPTSSVIVDQQQNIDGGIY
jgi:hypothetical protein